MRVSSLTENEISQTFLMGILIEWRHFCKKDDSVVTLKKNINYKTFIGHNTVVFISRYNPVL